MCFDSHLKKISVVHSDRMNYVYLNPLPDFPIRMYPDLWWIRKLIKLQHLYSSLCLLVNGWMSFNTHLKKLVWSTRIGRITSHSYLNPLSDSRIRPPWCGFLFIFRLMTLLSPPFILIWVGGVYGTNEGGVNNGVRLDFWGNLRPCWTPSKSSTIH